MNNAAKWSGFFKVVKPASETTRMTDNMYTDSSTYSNYSWYQRVVQGSSNRLSRYQEYDVMDSDVDISRAVDLVAEEMTNTNSDTKMPIDLVLSNDITQNISNATVTTIRTALRHWCKHRGFDTRLFNIARNLIKYGDVMFARVDDQENIVEQWDHVHPKNIMGAVVDVNNVTNVKGWQIRTDSKIPKDGLGVASNNTFESSVVVNDEVVHFTLNDDMSEEAPFGISVLACVYRATKQKSLLESAIIIYRIQRAPERRVFYIDVGKMPPTRTKAYLEQFKNELHQKKIPSMHGGQSNVESTYDPQSMSEDIYLPTRPNGNNTKVELLPGGQNLGELTDLEYFRQRVLEGLRIPPSFLPNFQSQDAGMFTDGSVGVAYLPEIQFIKYVKRLQSHISPVLDAEFKRFLHKLGVNVNTSLFTIKLPEPSNFEKYKEAAVNGVLLQQFGNADGIPYLSKRFIMHKYLMLSQADMALNESLLSQERGLNPKDSKSKVVLYNPDLMDPSTDETGMGDSVGGGGGMSGGSSPIADIGGANTEDGDNGSLNDTTNEPEPEELPNTP